MSLLRRIVSLFILLWLPLQGFAAITMPCCRDAASGAEHHQHRPPSSDAHAAHQHGNNAHADLFCNECGGCHLAAAPAVPSKSFELDSILVDAFGVASTSAFVSVIPSLSTPPPLSRAA